MTIEVIERATYELARARHRWHRRPRESAPTVVFSMAKTGSTAVAAGLQQAGTRDVYHVHDLDPDFLRREERGYQWADRPWRIWDGRLLERRPPTEAHPWRVVSIVRDPIAQSVSAFFQPGARLGYLGAHATVESLRERFGDRLEHPPLRWFESHVESALGIDVYETPFDHERGVQIIATPTVRLLLARVEHLDALPAALAELVGAPLPIAIPRVNVGATKDYAELYSSFARELRPDPATIERIYSSRLVRHFYSPAEIEAFRQRWTAGARDEAAR